MWVLECAQLQDSVCFGGERELQGLGIPLFPILTLTDSCTLCLESPWMNLTLCLIHSSAVQTPFRVWVQEVHWGCSSMGDRLQQGPQHFAVQELSHITFGCTSSCSCDATVYYAHTLNCMVPSLPAKLCDEFNPLSICSWTQLEKTMLFWISGP